MTERVVKTLTGEVPNMVIVKGLVDGIEVFNETVTLADRAATENLARAACRPVFVNHPPFKGATIPEASHGQGA